MTQPDLTTPTNHAPGRIVVAIATLGRGPILADVVRHLVTQTRQPDLVIVSGHSTEDFGNLRQEDVPFELLLLTGPKGTCRQRNLVLEMLPAQDLVLFIDDDFLLAPRHLERLKAIYGSHPDIVMTTGEVVADGIMGRGYSFEEGVSFLEAGLKAPVNDAITDVRNAYGCNMGMRMQTVVDHDLRFDEMLPLYGWFEDVDFSIRASQYGRVVKSGALRGVHLGTKTHRTAGKKLGYSQISNLVYLSRKGVMPLSEVLTQILRNFAANAVHSAFPVSYADHRGRLFGNLLAFSDLIRGRCDPRRITDF